MAAVTCPTCGLLAAFGGDDGCGQSARSLFLGVRAVGCVINSADYQGGTENESDRET